MKQTLAILGILLFASGLWAVSAQETDSHNEADNAALVQRGREVFTTMGCVACHGMEAQGTDLAPALAGHSEFAVRRQLRAPVGIMPVFNPTMVPAEDVEAVVAYVLSLVPVETATEAATEDSMAGMDMGGQSAEATAESSDAGGHAHQHSGIMTGDISFAHHWLLYLALQNGDKDGAIHQIGHIMPYMQGNHLILMQSVMDMLLADDLSGALAIVETMVADVNVFGEDADFVYLQMIYRALQADDSENSEHFITDFLEHGSNEAYLHQIHDVEAALESGDFEAAAAVLEAEYGETLLFEESLHEHEEGTDDNHDAEATEAATEESGHDAHHP